ncbi:hypothetical protein [Pseudomonas sp. BMS12]|uniref:hypothetical protein n=1 Tax=Pseudomonas sp. BMS12 TaxID=1796033 RepID=UPI0012907740|nr:hypothetical protein [Pseudomonas sp. BMS12]
MTTRSGCRWSITAQALPRSSARWGFFTSNRNEFHAPWCHQSQLAPAQQSAAVGEELFNQRNSDGSGSISRGELSSLLEAIALRPRPGGSEEKNHSGLIAKRLKHYQDSAR